MFTVSWEISWEREKSACLYKEDTKSKNKYYHYVTYTQFTQQ